MSLRLQGKIIRFPLMEYAKGLNIEISDRAISPLKLLWIALADFQNEKSGQCNPSIKTLAACIEKSESQTTVYMGLLKKLGLVVVSRYAKGGRTTPQYELPIPSHPVDTSASPPVDDTPQISSETSPPVKVNEGSHQQDPTPLVGRTRILIETLDKPLINSLRYEKNVCLKRDELIRLGKKYHYPFQSKTALHDVESWLVGNLNQPNLHEIMYDSH